MKICPFCAEEIQDAAIVCKHCGRDLEVARAPAVVAESVVDAVPKQPSSTDSPKQLLGLLIGLFGFFATVMGGSAAGIGFLMLWIGLALTLKGSPIIRWGLGFIGGLLLMAFGMSIGGQSFSPPAVSQSGAGAPSTPAAPQSSLTRSQQNAVRSAKSYVNISGFSRQDLIDQLSSDAGDRFSVGDATAAVDSLNVDWNTQAARSAAAYLKISGFSCQGLIEQLSSQAGDKYTVQQATYGATQAGAC